jgi:predicted ATPase
VKGAYCKAPSALHQAWPAGVMEHLLSAELHARGLDRFTRDTLSLLTSVCLFDWDSRPSAALGFPDAALVDAERALENAREIDHAATVMYALNVTTWTHIFCGDYVLANALADELAVLAEERGALYWKPVAMMNQGRLLGLIGESTKALPMLTSGIAAFRSTGATFWLPMHLSHLARTNANRDHYDDAWRCIREAISVMETTKETCWEVEVHCIVGQIALMGRRSDAVKAEAHFERALAVARQQQAKSWELRVAMSLARLWRDQGKPQQARELLAPVYGWFTEGFDTLDLKEAKALLEELV